MHPLLSFLLSLSNFISPSTSLPIDLSSDQDPTQVNNVSLIVTQGNNKLYQEAHFTTLLNKDLTQSELHALKWENGGGRSGALWIIASTPTQLYIADHSSFLALQNTFQAYTSGNQSQAHPLRLPNGDALIAYISDHNGRQHGYINRYSGAFNQILNLALQVTPDTTLGGYTHPQLLPTPDSGFILLYQRKGLSIKNIYGTQFDPNTTPLQTSFLISDPNDDINLHPFGASLKQYFFVAWTCHLTPTAPFACGRFLSFSGQPLTSVFPIDHNQTPTPTTEEYTTPSASFPNGGILATLIRYNPTQNTWSLWGKIYPHKESRNQALFPISTLSAYSPLQVTILENNVMIFAFFKNNNLCFKGFHKNLTTAFQENCTPNENYQNNTLLLSPLSYGRFALGRTASTNNQSRINIYRLQTPSINPSANPQQDLTWWEEKTTPQKAVIITGFSLVGLFFIGCIIALLIKKIRQQKKHLKNMIELQTKAANRNTI